jgi:16S rRNA (uracil1498-N3)-methyltransferase
MAERFHVKVELSPGQVVIDGPEAHHLGTVCRVRPGDAVVLFNGDGHEYPATVVEVGRRAIAVEVAGRRSPVRESASRLHIASALPKGDRAQFLVEKLTELGVAVLTPLVTERSVVQPREGKVDKLERYVIEASKQCGRNVLMRIDPPRRWADLVGDAALPVLRYVAHPEGEGCHVEEGGDQIVAIGPEGGLTDAEVALALAAGWRRLSLGPRILRIETAAMATAARWG